MMSATYSPSPKMSMSLVMGVYLDQGVEQDWVNQYLVLYQHAVLNESESSDVVKMSAARCATLVSIK